MHIVSLSPGLFSIEINGIRQLGIAIGPSKGSLVGTLSKSKESQGILIPADGNTRRPWEIAGFVAHEETLLAYGPWKDNSEHYSLIYTLDYGKALHRLVMLSRVVEILDREHVLPAAGLNLDGFVYFDDGSILVLPSWLQDLMRAGKNIVDRFLPYDALHHPSLKGSASWVFSLCVLAFRLKAGFFPYQDGSAPEEWTSRIVSKALETPRCRFPDAPDTLEKAYQTFLVRQEFEPDALSFLPSILSHWLEVENVLQNSIIDLKNAKIPLNKAQKSFESRLRRYQARRFVRYNRIWIGVSTAAILVALIIAGSILAQYFRTPFTAGMAPEALVQAFYGAFNTLNSELMEDATQNKTAQEYIGQISNLYILDKVRSASENRKIHFTPQEWVAAGKPGAEYSLMIFGIDELKITFEGLNSGNGLIISNADYILYSNISTQEENSQTQPVLPKTVRVTHKHDKLTLQKDTKGNWVIVMLQEVVTS